MDATGAESCFHCGEPVTGTRFSAPIEGSARSFCCAGCAAVAQTIARHGLAAYYDNRSGPAQRAAREEGDFGAYDLAAVQQPFVRDAGGGIRQATLLVEGITCGACAWLIEHALRRIAGVRAVAANVAARRVQVEWDAGRARLSGVLQALADLGYRPRGFDPAAEAQAAARERRAMLWRLFVAGFATMQVMMYALPAYVSDGEMTRDAEQLMRWASLVLTLPVMLWSAGPFFASAWRDLRSRRMGMDLPVALGLAVAFAASAWATVRGGGATYPVYFDSISMFVFLLLAARCLETLACARASESQRRLIGHLPAVADRLVPGAAPGVTERVAVAQLQAGDLVLVAPGSVIPADGELVRGRSAADESLLSGEARPVAKGPGAALTGGSINIESPITLRVTRVGAATVLAGIVRLMDVAQAARPRIAQLADRIAQVFVAVLLAVALATGIAWYAIDPQRALQVVVAVLVVSCPCALSLATPAALAAATDALQRLGILVTRGHALETLSRATHFVFDKTGTLTLGRLALTGIVPLGAASRERCLALAAALECGSAHPIARAIAAAACGAVPLAVGDQRNEPGRGVEARIDATRVRIGTRAFVAELVPGAIPAELVRVADDATVAALADEGGWLALFTFGDSLRPGARRLVSELQARGASVLLLSGDRAPAVNHLARSLGVTVAVAEAGPQAKLEFVRGLQAQGAVVAMVGDGANDAPVLAQAQVSVAMGTGADLARAGADLLLLGEDVGRLAQAFDIARRTLAVIRQNLLWAALYNAIALPVAIAGLASPLAAGIGMALSSLAVVLNALRLHAGPRVLAAPRATAPAPAVQAG
ncbi:MAG TPA: heavy metal translocating P-type ATPase [Burkholderiales bacterium]|nr:heavy metal translocating P-type ATPase [Burkholderiales bacterium]